MKQLLLALLILPIILQASENKYVIKGQIGKYNAPAKIYLVYESIVDSCELKNGKFSFTGTADYPILAQFILDSKNIGYKNSTDILKFYIEPGNITVTGKKQISTAIVQGSKTSRDYFAYQQILQPLKKKAKSLQKAHLKTVNEKRNTRSFTDSINEQLSLITSENKKQAIVFIQKHPNSFVSLFIIQSDLKHNSALVNESEALFNMLTPKIQQSILGKELDDLIQKNKGLYIGSVAPDFSISDIQGNPVKLSDYRGKHVLLMFWSSECGHCMQEMPQFVQTYNNFKNKNFEVLGVGIEAPENKPHFIETIQQLGILWRNVSEFDPFSGEIALKYQVYSTPYNFLINPEGKILTKNIYGSELVKALNQYIK